MKFQISTDYAIRILLYLHESPKGELPTAMSIAKAMGITYPFFIKVAHQLKQKGLLDTVQGRNGGYMLARPGGEISLYDVFLAIEGKLQINRCLEEDEFCSRDAVGACPIHDYLEELQASMVARMSKKYIADLVH